MCFCAQGLDRIRTLLHLKDMNGQNMQRSLFFKTTRDIFLNEQPEVLYFGLVHCPGSTSSLKIVLFINTADAQDPASSADTVSPAADAAA